MTISLSIPDELRPFLEQAVSSGNFGSEAEVVIEALESFRMREEFRQFQTERLRSKVQAGLEQIERGETEPWDLEEFKRRARAHMATK